MSRPIRCSCGRYFDDGKQPTEPPKPKEQTNHPKQTRTAWLALHEYAAKVPLWDEVDARKFVKQWERNLGCSTCGSAWKKLDWKFNYNSPEEFFESTVKAHNYVSTHHVNPSLPEVSMDNAYAMFWGKAPCNSNRLVITVATGAPFVKLLQLTKPTLQYYADKCGADYIELTNVTEDWWGLEKFRVGQFAKQYDQVLFIDADVIVRPTAPDLFDMVPTTHVGIHDDWNQLGTQLDWLHNDRKLLSESQGVEVADPDICLNSGVVLFSKQTASVWDRPPKPIDITHTMEQTWVEHNCLKHPIYNLPIEFNTQWWFPRFQQLVDKAEMVHISLAKGDLKYREVERYVKQWRKELSSGVRPELEALL